MTSAAPHTRTTSPPRAECRIDLAAYRHNIGVLTQRTGQRCEVWAVVKADAYGHGADRIAQEAIAAGARRLCVATLSEAHHLRAAGLRVPILVLGPLDAPSVERAAQLDVAVTVASREMVELLTSRPAGTARIRVHLKVDSGMTRWGVAGPDVVTLLERLDQAASVTVDGIMTHFATADIVDDDGRFDRQLATFEHIVAAVRERHPGIIVHAANSAATLRTPRAHFDAVRCGVATFGMDPVGVDPAPHDLRPVLSLRSHVATVVDVPPGVGVGYGATYVTTDDARIAQVPIGYADGVRRSLSGTGEVVIRGARRPIVGTLSMDHLAVRVGDDVEPGDVVTIIGADDGCVVTAEDHARWTGSINYEVTCLVATEPRLLRTFADT